MKRRIIMKANAAVLASLVVLFIVVWAPGHAGAEVNVQCPGDTNGNAIWDGGESPPRPDIKCMHLTAGDGFIRLADGAPAYIFGFSDVTGTPKANVMSTGMLGANFAAPTIALNEGQEFYLSLTNVGMTMRPDLFDPHTVHFHGYGNASTIFDGEPMASTSISMGNTLTYYYNINEPGTYMYHCHVEATEHMQMGMLGNLYVHPAQDGTDVGGCGSQLYVYNDGDGSTCYDVEYPVQIHNFDPRFHNADASVQPLPFADMKDTYPMLNGRGYPDTVNDDPAGLPVVLLEENGGKKTQLVNTKITASAGQKILLRISSLATVDYHTLTVLGIPMRVVGKSARLLRGPGGQNLFYTTSTVSIGGGESVDVILDTAGIPDGTYFLYTTNLNHLNNNEQDFGGMMTEIVIGGII